MTRVLVADDDDGVRSAVSRVLTSAGHEVTGASDAQEALVAIARGPFDVIVTDIVMPGLNGVELLRDVRRRDLDVPVILMTGTPSIETAVNAVDLGAFRYLIKPIDAKELVRVVGRASSLHRLARAKREALELLGDEQHLLGDRASLEARFEAALASLWMAFQPIVSQRERCTVAYEALLRNEEPTLKSPPACVAAAERLGRVHELGRAVRRAVADAMVVAPSGVDLFVNLHAADLADDELSSPSAPLSAHASRVVLEITERASLEQVAGAPERVTALRGLGYRIAVDDLGAGYAGLTSLTTLEPEVVKIDMTLVRGVDADPKRQHVVRSLLELCRELSMRVVVDGVETAAERGAVVSLGGDVMQGYHYGRPSRDFIAIAPGAWG